MKELIEMVGKKKGYDIITIHNCYDRIDKGISELSKAKLQKNVEEIILIAIEYGTHWTIRNKYPNIFQYAQEEC